MTAGGSVPLQGTVQPLVDGFQSGFFGSADFAQRQQLWNVKTRHRMSRTALKMLFEQWQGAADLSLFMNVADGAFSDCLRFYLAPPAGNEPNRN